MIGKHKIEFYPLALFKKSQFMVVVGGDGGMCRNCSKTSINLPPKSLSGGFLHQLETEVNFLDYELES